MRDQHAGPRPLTAALPAVLFVTAMFFHNFLARVVLGPLMVSIEAETGVSHTQAGLLLFLMSAGVSLSLFLSSFLSARVAHRRVIAASGLILGTSLLAASAAGSLPAFAAALFCVGCGAGLYLPSGIATLTGLVEPRDWGKVLALHELAPNLAFIAAPLLAEAMIELFSWRAALAAVGCSQLALGLAFACSFRGGRFMGMAPSPSVIRGIVREPIFWAMAALFCLGLGASIGPYAMLPLYLTDEHGYTREAANRLLSISRLAAVGMALAAGWLTDRFGARRTILGYLLAGGAATAFLGLASGGFLVVAAVLQPMVSVCFFPAGFTAISHVYDARRRGAAVGLITTFSAVIGAGAVPALIGWLGDRSSFSHGFLVVSGALFALLAVTRVLPGRDIAAS